MVQSKVTFSPGPTVLGGGKGDRGQFRRRHIGLGAFNGEAEVDVLEGRRAWGDRARVVAGGGPG